MSKKVGNTNKRLYASYLCGSLHTVATQLCNILLENAPVDDIITVFSSHDLLVGDDLTVITNAPSDFLKKVFLLGLFQNVALSVWSIICDVVNKTEILKHIGDELVKGNYMVWITLCPVEDANVTVHIW